MHPENEIFDENNFSLYWEKKFNDPNYRHDELSKVLLQYLLNLIQEVNGYILDHGCGGGRVSLELVKRGKEIAVCDISLTALDKTLLLLKNNNFSEKIMWAHHGAIEAWHGEKGWGGVCSHRVLHAIPKYLRERTINCLVSGLILSGKLLLTAKSINCKRFDLLKRDKEFEPIEGDGQSFLRKNPFRYIHYFSKEELSALLTKSGLSILAIEEFEEKTGNLWRSEDTLYNRYWLFYCEKKSEDNKSKPQWEK